MIFLQGRGFFADPLSKRGELILGGSCNLSGALSPNTNAPLTQFARLHLSKDEFFIPGWDMPEVHLLYSWKCSIHEGDFSYRYARGGVEVVEFQKGNGNYDDFPYRDYPSTFAEVRMGLRRIADEDQALILELNKPDVDPDLKFDNVRAGELSVPTHQFGGVPYLTDPEIAEKRCIGCGGKMPLVASIGNKSYSNNEGFFGDDFVQVLYWACSQCYVVSALNYCE